MGDPGIFISDYAKELHDIKKTLIDKFEDNPFILFQRGKEFRSDTEDVTGVKNPFKVKDYFKRSYDLALENENSSILKPGIGH